MQSASVDSQMKTTNDSAYTRKLTQCIKQTHDVILKIPELSSKQKDDMIKFRQRLEDLDLKTGDAKIKLAFVDVMNSMS